MSQFQGPGGRASITAENHSSLVRSAPYISEEPEYLQTQPQSNTTQKWASLGLTHGGGGSAWGRGAEYVGWGQPGALQLPSCPELGLFRSLDGQRAAQEERRMWWVRRT